MDDIKYSISMIQDFQRCPLRGCFKWVANRVPAVRESDALSGGKLGHKAFEFFNKFPLEGGFGTPPEGYASPGHALEYLLETEKVYDTVRRTFEELVEPLQWYVQPGDTVEAEKTHEVRVDGRIFRYRPDRIYKVGTSYYHEQYKFLAASTKLEQYFEAQNRSLHELVYAHLLRQENPDWDYRGSNIQVILKRKYRSQAKGREGKILNEPQTFFANHEVLAWPASCESAWAAVRWWMEKIDATIADYKSEKYIAENRQEDISWGSLDGYLPALEDPALLKTDLFQDREDYYDE